MPTGTRLRTEWPMRYLTRWCDIHAMEDRFCLRQALDPARSADLPAGAAT